MVRKWPGFSEPGSNELALREIEPSAVAPRPAERELRVIPLTLSEQGGGLQSATSDPGGIWPEEVLLDPNVSDIEGWVAGLPVVGGVADSGWQPCKGGRVRLVVHVVDSLEQREWVRAMAHGGAYAEEVLW